MLYRFIQYIEMLPKCQVTNRTQPTRKRKQVRTEKVTIQPQLLPKTLHILVLMEMFSLSDRAS